MNFKMRTKEPWMKRKCYARPFSRICRITSPAWQLHSSNSLINLGHFKNVTEKVEKHLDKKSSARSTFHSWMSIISILHLADWGNEWEYSHLRMEKRSLQVWQTKTSFYSFCHLFAQLSTGSTVVEMLIFRIFVCFSFSRPHSDQRGKYQYYWTQNAQKQHSIQNVQQQNNNNKYIGQVKKKTACKSSK